MPDDDQIFVIPDDGHTCDALKAALDEKRIVRLHGGDVAWPRASENEVWKPLGACPFCGVHTAEAK